MGGKGGAQEAASKAGAAQDLTLMQSMNLYNKTAPFRTAYYNMFNDLLSGKIPLEQEAFNPAFSAMLRPVNAQYDVARENVLGNTPVGGRLQDELTNVETARAGSVGNLTSQWITDMMNKMYGVAFQTPQTSMAGLENVMNLGSQAAQGVAQGAGKSADVCCFIFIEGDRLSDNVKTLRDKMFPKGGLVENGYRRMAGKLVPMMAKNWLVKKAVQILMLNPICAIADNHFGRNHYGWIFWPVGWFWKWVWEEMGRGNTKSILGQTM
jgi:hypothetical protein